MRVRGPYVGRWMALAGVLGHLLLWLVVTPVPARAEVGRSQGQELAALREQKLRAETEQLEAETDESSGLKGWVSTLASLTGLAAILTVIGSLVGFGYDRKRQREQRADAQGQQAEARRQQLEEHLGGLLLSLGDKSEAVQAGAAVSLQNFLSEEHEQFHRQVCAATLANLKVTHPVEVKKLLVRTFEQALRASGALPATGIDLSHAYLAGARLSELDFTEAMLDEVNLDEAKLTDAKLAAATGRKANLTRARITGERASLRNAKLYEVEARKASFSGANLNNTHMKDGNLEGASFCGARLQAAHFEGSRLFGADFDGANVADAYFTGAKLDSKSLASLASAHNWEKAHLSTDDKRAVEAFATTSSRQVPGDGEAAAKAER
jgi:uncharacterized protein YjbI with pentapeptide repeats